MDLTDPNADLDNADEFHFVLRIATSKIFDGVEPDEFLRWAGSAIPLLAPAMFAAIDPASHAQAAYWMGRALWNSAPLPANNFRPAPLPKPERNLPCPCGSTLKYKHCCAGQPQAVTLPEDIFWLMLPQVYSKQTVNQLLKTNRFPVEGIAAIANFYYEAGDDAQVIKILDPLFAGEASRIGHHHEALLDMLCDAYNNHYRTDRKKRELLERMCQHPSKAIRGAAWQRMASWQIDLGNVEAAHEALSHAMRANPDDPSHALLELIMLVSSQQIDQARQRAAFWFARLKRDQQEFPELLATLGLARTDPVQALQSHMRQPGPHGDDRLDRLLTWLQLDSPLPRYSVEFWGNADTADCGRDPLTRDLFNDGQTDDDLDFADPVANSAVLRPPEDIFRLESRWDKVCPVQKPFSVAFEPTSSTDTWSDPQDDGWLRFLEQHPQAINSLEVLDDILTLIFTHPLSETPYGPMRDCYPVLQRAQRIVECVELPASRTLPWVIQDNRPLLRLLAHQILICEQLLGDKTESIRLSERYLRFNPGDNHGYRTALVNYYLHEDRNEEAAALSGKYPDDMLADTRYGRVLALYRLGDEPGAAHALSGAAQDLPLVMDYLCRARVAKPKLHEDSVMIGGKDQAWIYRNDMRDCWMQTPGCLEWLKRQ